MIDNTEAVTINVPDYIERRMRLPVPEGCCVVDNHEGNPVPMCSYGNVRKARVAVINLNPGSDKKPHTTNRYYLANQPLSTLQRIYHAHNTFFDWFWKFPLFGRLEIVLKECGFSLGGARNRVNPAQESSAVCLELSQWTTWPEWGGLGGDVKEKLLNDGVPFLQEIIEQNQHVELLLGNGRGVLNTLQDRFSVKFEYVGSINITKAETKTVEVYRGNLLGRQFVGWSEFLPRSGMTNLQLAELGRWVCELYREKASQA